MTKKNMAALALCLISMAGCGTTSEPIYNVGYSYNLESHEYTVFYKEDPRGLEERRTVPLEYVTNIAVREYPKHHYSSEEWVVVRNEYLKGANRLYIYSQI